MAVYESKYNLNDVVIIDVRTSTPYECKCCGQERYERETKEGRGKILEICFTNDCTYYIIEILSGGIQVKHQYDEEKIKGLSNE